MSKNDAFGSAKFNFRQDMGALKALKKPRTARPIAVSPVHNEVYQEAKTADPSFLEDVAGAAKSFGRGVVIVSTAFGLSKAGAIFEKKITDGTDAKDIGDYLGLPGLKMTGFDFGAYPSVGVASAAEEKTDYWGEWKYLMDGKPTDSWYDTAVRQLTYFFKLLTDTKFSEFVSKMRSGDTITAYAIATGKSLEGMTEAQKKAIACSDAIYAAGADECKTISADDQQLGLGATTGNQGGVQGGVDGLDPVYNEIKALPYGINNPVVFSKAKGEIKSDYIEAVFYGSGGNNFYMGVKVKPGTPDDKVASIQIERANVQTRRLINIQFYGNSYKIGSMTTNMDELAGIKFYTQNGRRMVEIPNLPEILKADNDKYVIDAADAHIVMNDRLLDKTRI